MDMPPPEKGIISSTVMVPHSFGERMRSAATGSSEETTGTGGAPAKWSARAEAALRSLSCRQKVAVLIITAVVIYGSFIAADGLGMRQVLDANFGPTPDLPIYQERTKLILNGGMLYRDLDIESPPLINYILLPPQLLGGEWWLWEAYFSMFPLLLAIALYSVMRRWDDFYAFLAAWILVACPYAVQDATWGIQDEPLVAFFYLLPVLLFMRGHRRTAGAVMSIGFWTKFLPVIQYPVLLLQIKSWRERLINLAWTAGAFLLIMLPFLLIAPIEFLNFPSYYLLGRDEEGSAGMSLIYLLSRGGLYIDGLVGAGLTVAVLILSYYLVHKWGLDVWRGAMLSTVMFLSVYPMIRLSYFILPFAFFVIWAVRDKGTVLRIALMYLALLFGQGIAASDMSGLGGWSWLAAFLLVLAGLLIMLDITRTCLKDKCFLDKEPAEEVEGTPGSA